MTSPPQSPAATRTRAHRPIMRLALPLLLLTLLPACKPANTNTYTPPPAPEVTVAHPLRRPVTRYFEYTGTTEAFETVDLRARVAGFLDQVNFKPGAVVKKGDLLFVIDPRVYEAAVRQAEADLAAREATLRLAENTLQRFTGAATAVARQEIDKAVADRDAAAAQVELARAAVVTARLNVEFSQVRSPIDGRITKNFVDVGNYVGAAGQPTVLATVVNARPIYVTVDASESDVFAVRRERLATAPGAEPGQIAPGEWRPVDMATADSDAFNIRGRIDYVDPALNPQTGTIRVRCRFENENNGLLPGMFVRLRVLLGTEEATVAPDTALLTDQSGRYALVVNDKDAVELRRVRIGTLDGQMRVVLDGLAPTDRLIVNGLQRARPGITVKPTLRELAPASSSAPASPTTTPGQTNPAAPPPAAPANSGRPSA